jgi:formylglycine-generating enzyme required for sulfatase activity
MPIEELRRERQNQQPDMNFELSTDKWRKAGRIAASLLLLCLITFLVSAKLDASIGQREDSAISNPTKVLTASLPAAMDSHSSVEISPIIEKNKATETIPFETIDDAGEIIAQLERNMVMVEGGSFQMGCTSEQKDCEDDESPVHAVQLSGFKINKYEVSQKEWYAVMTNYPKQLKFKGCAQCPVEGVSWNNVQTFLQRLNQKTKGSYRLPTEAEWEYAARGGKVKSKNHLFSGSEILSSVGWYYDNSDFKTHPVGYPSMQPNDLGLYDMSGNVWEWCSDYYGSRYYSDSPKINPKGPENGIQRVIRGGSWVFQELDCRVACRNYFLPGKGVSYIGFRLARSL